MKRKKALAAGVLFLMLTATQLMATLVIAAESMSFTLNEVEGSSTGSGWECSEEKTISGTVSGGKSDPASSSATFKNTSKTKPALVTFDYSVQTEKDGSYVKIKIDGADEETLSSNGSKSITLEVEKSFTIEIYAVKDYGSASISITDFNVLQIEPITVTLLPPLYGSYTASTTTEGQEDVTMTPDSAEVEFTYSSVDGITLAFDKSNVPSEYHFTQWENQNEMILSEEYSSTIFGLANGDSVNPSILHVGVVQAFKVRAAEGSYKYSSWQKAMERAVETGGVVVLSCDYTLPVTEETALAQGEVFDSETAYVKRILNEENVTTGIEYIVPDGVTLLIPYDDANTVITDNMGDYVEVSSAAKTLYRQLTMPSGSRITVASGAAINVGSRAHRQMVGQFGPYGAIKMDSGSNITVQAGGTLYAWGYILHGDNGSGAVTIENGGMVYETLMTMDYPGSASKTSSLYSSDKIFPLRAFTVRNVEVPMILEYGAIERAFFHFYGTNSIVGENPGYVEFIGNKADYVFQLLEGSSIVKSYSSGKQKLTINGSVNMNSIGIRVKSTDIDSSSTTGFPIPSGYNITIASGTFTMSEPVIVTEGSKLTISKDAVVETNGKNVYIFDADDDDGSVAATDLHGFQYSPVTEDAIVDVNGTIIVSGGFYTSKNKAAIISSEGTGRIEFTKATNTGNVKIKTGQNVASPYEVYSASLKNGNGTYTETRNSTTFPNTYIYSGAGVEGKWVCSNHAYGEGVVTTESTCATKGIKTFTCSACGAIYTEEIPLSNNHSIDPNTGICKYNCGLSYKALVYSNGTDAAASNRYYSEISGNEGALKVTENETSITIRLYEDYRVSDILNLNGRNIEGKVTVAENGMIVDSATDGYDNTVAGTITDYSGIASVYNPQKEDGALYGKHYAVVTTTEGTQFHRVGVSVTAYRFYLNNKEAILTVEGTFRGTADGLEALTQMGFVVDDSLVVSGVPTKDDTYTVSGKNGIYLPVYYSFQTAGENGVDNIAREYEVLCRLFFGSGETVDALDNADSALRTVSARAALNAFYDATEESSDTSIQAMRGILETTYRSYLNNPPTQAQD